MYSTLIRVRFVLNALVNFCKLRNAAGIPQPGAHRQNSSLELDHIAKLVNDSQQQKYFFPKSTTWWNKKPLEKSSLFEIFSYIIK